MATVKSLDSLLSRLENQRLKFGPGEGTHTAKLVSTLAHRRTWDVDSLIRFHEALLFVRAYPQSRDVLEMAEELLATFSQRVQKLEATGADMSAWADEEVSGIAGSTFSAVFSYATVQRLAQLHSSQIDVNWELHDRWARLGETCSRFLPLLEEDAMVEANVPYAEWLRAAQGGSQRDLLWLLNRFKRLPVSEEEKAQLFNSLDLAVKWDLCESHASRSKMRREVQQFFYHDRPLIRRREISLDNVFLSPPLPLSPLPRVDGQALLDMALETSATRYRELHGFTYGDPARILRADVGRGVEIFLCQARPQHRLPLRAYHAGLIFKNGVPIGYVEGLTLFDRTEMGFNLYYTFREGETAWLYATILRLFHQALGVTSFSIDPYQIGYHNEEAIESGAFWFYRKLGFRPVRSELVDLLRSEEKKAAAKPQHRTSPRVLRRLSAGPMVYEVTGSPRGDWDQFQVRDLGIAVQRRMALRHKGSAEKICNASCTKLEKALGVTLDKWKRQEKRAFRNLSLVLALIPDLSRWSEAEKRNIVRIIRAKAGPEESRYVRLLQANPRLRTQFLKLGSRDLQYACLDMPKPSGAPLS